MSMSDKMYEKVIESGNFENIEMVYSDYSWLFFVTVGLLVCLVFYSVYVLFADEEEKLFLLIPLGFILFLGCVMHVTYVNSEKVDVAVTEWKNTHVVELFEQLPVEKSEVVYIKIDTAISNELRGGRYWIETDTKKLTPLVVSFKSDEGIETVTDWFSTKMVLTDEDRPYIEYKRLVKDLGNDVNAGVYDAVVYLPEDYTFTDIK